MPDPSSRLPRNPPPVLGSQLPATVENPSPVLDPDAQRIDTARQLPPHRGKVGRVADHLAAISADARDWVELRIDLVKAEVTEKIDETKSSVERKAFGAAFLAAAGVVALYGLGFLFALLAVGLGWAFAGHDGAEVLRPLFWGLLITTVLLFAIAGVLGLIGKNKLEAAKAIDASLKTPEFTESDASAPGLKTRHQLQDMEAAHARQTTA